MVDLDLDFVLLVRQVALAVGYLDGAAVLAAIICHQFLPNLIRAILVVVVVR